METFKEKLLRLEYYQEIFLSKMNNSYPFFALIMVHQLSKKEVEEIYFLCEQLDDEYKKQKKEGFVTFLPLLTHFVGMLNYKLDPNMTINALYEQQLFCELMSEFRKLIGLY